MISTYVRWNQSQQVSIEMIKQHSNREQILDINEVSQGDGPLKGCPTYLVAQKIPQTILLSRTILETRTTGLG